MRHSSSAKPSLSALAGHSLPLGSIAARTTDAGDGDGSFLFARQASPVPRDLFASAPPPVEPHGQPGLRAGASPTPSSAASAKRLAGPAGAGVSGARALRRSRTAASTLEAKPAEPSIHQGGPGAAMAPFLNRDAGRANTAASESERVRLAALAEKRSRPFSQRTGGHGFAESYTVADGTSQWQFLGGEDEVAGSADRPATRRDAALLRRRFEQALRVLRQETEAGAGLERTPAPAPDLEQDLRAMREEAREALGPLEDAVSRLGTAPAPPEDGSDVEGALGTEPVSPQAVAEDWRTLAASKFQQKWTDLTLGRIMAHVSVAFSELGDLLRLVRAEYARAFSAVADLHHRTALREAETTSLAASLRTRLAEHGDAEAERMRRERARQDEELRRLKQRYEGELESAQQRVDEALDREERTSAGLRALDEMVQDMRSNANTSRVIDLRDASMALQRRLEDASHELKQLRPLRARVAVFDKRMEEKDSELASTRKELAATRKQLDEQKQLCNDLLQREQSRLAAMEEARAGATTGEAVHAAGDGADAVHASGEAADAGERALPSPAATPATENSSSPRARGPIRRISSTATASDGAGGGGGDNLCIRCGRQLDRVARMGEVARAEDRLASREARGRPVCRAYRSLLPNLQAFEPQRSARWVLARVRAILASYADEHASAVHSRRLRVRFPEFVHAWFAPPHRVLAECTTRAAREALHARADEQRWALYYGCRDLARGKTEGMRRTLAPEGDNRGAMAAARALEAAGADEDEDEVGAAGMPEARLFFTLLDEQMGEDAATFLVHTWTAVRAAAGSAVQFGVPVSVDCDHDLHNSLVNRDRDRDNDTHGALGATGEAARGGGASWLQQSENALPADVPSAKAEVAACEAVPLFVWLMLEHAAGAVRRVLARATETERASVLKAVVDAGVSTHRRVPDAVVRTARGAQGPGRCADLHVFFALILHEYRQEQSQRRAATRLMFHSALDALRATPGVGLGGPVGWSRSPSRSGRAAQQQQQPAQRSLDLQRFAGILTTLNARVTPPTVLSLYRDAYELGGGVVDYQAFVDAAERRQFFSSCLRLPLHAPAEGSEELTLAQRTTLDNIVRFHAQIVRPAVQVTLSQVYSADREHGLGLLAQLEEALYSGGGASRPASSESPAGDKAAEQRPKQQQQQQQQQQEEAGSPSLDGRRALWAYRRLLVFLLQLRARTMERIGDAGGGMAITRVEREIEAYIRLLRESAQRTAEVLATENKVEEMWRSVALVARTRKNISVVRIQRMWRVRRQARAQFPRLLRACLSTHFARSGPRPQGRVAARPLPWLLAFVSAILAAKARSDTARTAQRLAPTPLQECVYDVCLSIAGVRRAAERLVHDLVSATYRYWAAHPRAQLFGLLLGMQPPSSLSRSASSAMALLGAHAPGVHGGAEGAGRANEDAAALSTWIATPQAVVYVTEVLVAVWREMRGLEGTAASGAEEDPVPLFPPSDDQEQCQVPLLAVIRAFDRIHPPASPSRRHSKQNMPTADAAPMPRYLERAIRLASAALADGREASRRGAPGAASNAADEEVADSASVGCLSALEGESDADGGDPSLAHWDASLDAVPATLPRESVPEAKDPAWTVPRLGARRLGAERFLERMLRLASDPEDGSTGTGPVVDLDAALLVWMFEWATAAERATLDLSAAMPPRVLLFDGAYSVLDRATRKHTLFAGHVEGHAPMSESQSAQDVEPATQDPLAVPLATRLATQKRNGLDALDEELKLARATAQQGSHALQSGSPEEAAMARRLDRRWSEAQARYADAFQFGAVDPRLAAQRAAREAAIATPFAAQAIASSTKVLFALVDHTWRPYQGPVREALQRVRMELNAQLHVVRDSGDQSGIPSPRAVGSPSRVFEAKGIFDAVSTWVEALDQLCRDPGARSSSRGVNAALSLLRKVLTGVLRCRKLLGVSRQFESHHIADQWD